MDDAMEENGFHFAASYAAAIRAAQPIGFMHHAALGNERPAYIS
jgi:hypothetical protein